MRTSVVPLNVGEVANVSTAMITRTVSKGLVGGVAVAATLLSGCASSSSPKSSASATPTTAGPAAVPATKVTGSAFSPEKGSTQGVGGKGIVVDLAFKSAQATALQSSFRLGGALPDPAPPAKPGHNPAFPGLVVTLSTTGAPLGGPTENLANLFQIVSTSTQSDGSSEVWATWTNAKPGFGVDLDSELVAYTISGDAPDVVPSDRSSLALTSNLITVTFHVAGPKASPAPTTTAP